MYTVDKDVNAAFQNGSKHELQAHSRESSIRNMELAQKSITIEGTCCS